MTSLFCVLADLLIQESGERSEGRRVPITVYLGSNPDPNRARIDVRTVSIIAYYCLLSVTIVLFSTKERQFYQLQ